MSASEVEVRDAHLQDAPWMVGLHLRVLAEGQWFVTEPQEARLSLEGQTARLRALAETPGSACFVARREGRGVGFLVLEAGPLRRLRHNAKLEVLVASTERGRGVGAALLGHAIEWAEASPVLTKLGLAVFSDNERAIRLYRRHGFVEEGRREREYRLADGTYRSDILMGRGVG